MKLIHKKCGGSLNFDVTGLYKLRTPALSTYSGRISLEIVEIVANSSPGSIKFQCGRCDKLLEIGDGGVEMDCGCCAESFPLEKLYWTAQIQSLCKKCLEYLKTGDGEDVGDCTKAVGKYIKISESEKHIPMLDLFKQNIEV